MRFKKLFVEDFCCFDSFELPLDSQGLVLISGENKDTDSAVNNGAGKSTIAKALTWCLYGKTIDGERGDKVISDRKKRALVQLELRDASGDLWKIKRERKKGMMVVDLVQPNDELFKASKDDIQKKIVEMVGLDFHAFKSTVLYGQNDTSRFAYPKTKDSERKKMLHDILRTSILEKCHKLVLNKRREINLQISSEEKELLVVKTRLEGLDLEDKIKQEGLFEQDKKDKILEYKKNIRKFKQKAIDEIESTKDEQVLSDFDEKISICKKEIKDLEKDIKEREKSEKIVEGIDKQLEYENTITKTELVNELMKIKAKINSLTDRIEKISGEECPVCTSNLKIGDAAKFRRELLKNRKTLYKKEKNVSLTLANVDALINKLKKEKFIHENLFKDIVDVRNRINFCESLIVKNKIERESFKERKKKSKNVAKEYIILAKKELKGLKKVKIVKNPYTKERKNIEKKIKEYKSKEKEINRKILEKSNELRYIQFWERGFSNQGLPSFILDSAMPFLAKRANSYLRVLSDGDIKIDFSTQRELKNRKEKKDEIEITWEIEGYKNYPPSGGQLKKIELATDFALMDLVATKEGGYVDLLMLDEILDGLDSEGSRRVVLLLKKLRKYRSSIFVISHLPEISESFEQSISVIKKDGVSKLEYTS